MQTTIERELKSIFDQITSTASDGCVVLEERPNKGTSCKGIISIYRRDDLRRQDSREADVERDGRPFRAIPVVRYAFYPSVYNPSVLGSVAIYGKRAVLNRLSVRKNAFFFGRRVTGVKTEIGRRPFIDVRFAPQK